MFQQTIEQYDLIVLPHIEAADIVNLSVHSINSFKIVIKHFLVIGTYWGFGGNVVKVIGINTTTNSNN